MTETSLSFACSVCGRPAGTLTIGADGLRRESFTSTLTQPVSDATAAHLAGASARELHALDPELAPFYCPACDVVYCGEHWQRWDVFDPEEPSWHEGIRGRCPEGHERRLED